MIFVINLIFAICRKTQYFVHLSFNSTLQLIDGISNDLQILIKCLNGAAILAFSKIRLT